MTAAIYPSNLIATVIGGYQRFISPYKGFCCAYRARSRKRDSCSQFAKRVAVRRGVLALPGLLRERFKRCAAAAKVLDYRRVEPEERRRRSKDNINSWGDCAGDACAHGACDAIGEAACCGIDALV